MEYKALIVSLREHELKMIEEDNFSELISTQIFTDLKKLRYKLQAQ